MQEGSNPAMFRRGRGVKVWSDQMHVKMDERKIIWGGLNA